MEIFDGADLSQFQVSNAAFHVSIMKNLKELTLLSQRKASYGQNLRQLVK